MGVRLSLVTGLLALAYASPIQAQFAVAPRVSYYFDNSSQRLATLDDRGVQRNRPDIEQDVRAVLGPNTSVQVTTSEAAQGIEADPIGVLMYGGSISYADDRNQFIFTSLYGKGDVSELTALNSVTRANINGIVAEDLATRRLIYRGNAWRFDAEMSYQRRLNENFALIGGFRFEQTIRDATAEFDSLASQNIENLVAQQAGQPSNSFELRSLRGEVRQRVRSRTYSARVGGAAFLPVSEAAFLYVNGLLHVSHSPSADLSLSVTGISPESFTDESTRSSTYVGPDISVGLFYRLSQLIGFDVRYRGAFYFPVGGPIDFGNPRVSHGLLAGAQFQF